MPEAWLPSSAGGGVAEGRGGVVKLSLTTDLYRRRFHTAIGLQANFQGLPSRASQKPNSWRGLALESHEKLQPRREEVTTYLKELGIRVMRFENRLRES